MTGRILQDFKNVRCFMSIIDQQSIQIIELQTQVDLLHNEVFELRKGKDSQEVISELMARIDVQADRIAELEAQVAALKKITEEERAAMLVCAEDLRGIDDGHLIEARRQLAEEHPEIDWE